MIGITEFRAVFHEVRRLASENPTFVYGDQFGNSDSNRPGSPNECSYLGASRTTPEEGQGCIIGQAVTNLGFLTREQLAPMEDASAVEVLIHAVASRHTVSDAIYIGLYDLGEWFKAVQRYQDSGLSWSKAIERADFLCPKELDTLSRND